MITLIVTDIETLGMAPPAAVIELGWCSLVHTDAGVWELGEDRDSVLFGMQGQTMSPDNRAVHHINPAVLAGRVEFREQRWWKFSHTTPTWGVAHNSEFEASFLGSEVPWICTYKVALRLLPDAPSHSNQALKYLLGIEDVAAHHPPHRALPDCIVTALILQELVARAQERSPDLSVEDVLCRMAEITLEPALHPRCPIGKHRGQPWADIPSDYLAWISRTTDMGADIRWCAERELTRRRRDDVPLGDYRNPA